MNKSIPINKSIKIKTLNKKTLDKLPISLKDLTPKEEKKIDEVFTDLLNSSTVKSNNKSSNHRSTSSLKKYIDNIKLRKTIKHNVSSLRFKSNVDFLNFITFVLFLIGYSMGDHALFSEKTLKLLFGLAGFRFYIRSILYIEKLISKYNDNILYWAYDRSSHSVLNYPIKTIIKLFLKSNDLEIKNYIVENIHESEFEKLDIKVNDLIAIKNGAKQYKEEKRLKNSLELAELKKRYYKMQLLKHTKID